MQNNDSTSCEEKVMMLHMQLVRKQIIVQVLNQSFVEKINIQTKLLLNLMIGMTYTNSYIHFDVASNHGIRKTH